MLVQSRESGSAGSVGIGLICGVGQSRTCAVHLCSLGAGDYGSTDYADPGIEYVIADGPLPGTWKLTDIADGWADFLGAWEGLCLEATEYRELDGERVLVLINFWGRGERSGLELGQMRTKGASVFHLHGGKVTKHILYWNRENAFADLGLASQTRSPDA
jgi:hypothetical protein